MKLEYFEMKHKLDKEYDIEFETCPPGGHYMHKVCIRSKITYHLLL